MSLSTGVAKDQMTTTLQSAEGNEATVLVSTPTPNMYGSTCRYWFVKNPELNAFGWEMKSDETETLDGAVWAAHVPVLQQYVKQDPAIPLDYSVSLSLPQRRECWLPVGKEIGQRDQRFVAF